MLSRIPIPSKNVLNPLLWLIGILAVSIVPATVWLPTWAAILGWGLLLISVGTALWAYQHFARSDPSQLRSEDHALKLEALNIYNRQPGSGDQIAQILAPETRSLEEYVSRKIGEKDA